MGSLPEKDIADRRNTECLDCNQQEFIHDCNYCLLHGLPVSSVEVCNYNKQDKNQNHLRAETDYDKKLRENCYYDGGIK